MKNSTLIGKWAVVKSVRRGRDRETVAGKFVEFFSSGVIQTYDEAGRRLSECGYEVDPSKRSLKITYGSGSELTFFVTIIEEGKLMRLDDENGELYEVLSRSS